MPSSATSLWVLLFGVVMFVTVFGLFSQFASEIYGVQKQYEYFIASARDVVSGATYANTVNFTLEQEYSQPSPYGSKTHSENMSNLNILFDLGNTVGMENPAQPWLGVFHVESQIGPLVTAYPLTFDDGTYASYRHILPFYDPISDSATFTMSCPHIKVNIVMRSNDSTVTLPDCLVAGGAIRLIVSWNPSYEHATSSGFYDFIFRVMTFQTFSTGETYSNLLLNAITSVPIYVAVGYILWRILTGSIPTLSGGGGQ